MVQNSSTGLKSKMVLVVITSYAWSKRAGLVADLRSIPTVLRASASLLGLSDTGVETSVFA